MQQVIVDFGAPDILGLRIPLRIYGYGLMLVLGFLLGIYLARWRARRAGESADHITHCGLLALVGGIAGSRAAYIFQHWDEQFAHEANKIGAILNVSSGGLIYYGGLILGTVLVLGYLRLKRLPIRRYLDLVAVSLMIGLAFGRAGCLLNGCCYGGPCRHDWALGMRFPMFSSPLLMVGEQAGPFSASTEGPSPVYGKQTREGVIHPDERLCLPGGYAVLAPRSLHGRLDRDQLTVLFGERKAAEQDFVLAAGPDEKMDLEEWRKARRAGEFLRGSEAWDAAVCFDRDGDGKLSFPETWEYLQASRALLTKRFDADGDGTLQGPERDRANAYLQEDLYALAAAGKAEPVQPAQPLGILNALLLAALLNWFYRLRRREGQVFALLTVMYPVTRFVLEAIRDDNPHHLAQGVLTHNQYTSLALAAVGVLLLLVIQRLPASAGPALAERTAAAHRAGRGGTAG